MRHSLGAQTILLLPLSLGLFTASGASISRSFINNTGQVVNDFHLLERNGMNTIVSLTSGTGPGLSNLPATTAPKGGGGAQNTATLSGANVPIGGQVNVHIQIPDSGLLGNSGFLDWQWSNNGNPVGPVHLNAQAIFATLNNVNGFGMGNVTVVVENGSSSAADYTNFELGTLASGFDITSMDEDPGGLGAGATILLGPTSFIVPADSSASFNLSNVDLTRAFGSYGDVTVGGDSFFQFQTGQIPEPQSIMLFALGSGALFFRLLKRPRRSKLL